MDAVIKKTVKEVQDCLGVVGGKFAQVTQILAVNKGIFKEVWTKNAAGIPIMTGFIYNYFSYDDDDNYYNYLALGTREDSAGTVGNATEITTEMITDYVTPSGEYGIIYAETADSTLYKWNPDASTYEQINTYNFYEACLNHYTDYPNLRLGNLHIMPDSRKILVPILLRDSELTDGGLTVAVFEIRSNSIVPKAYYPMILDCNLPSKGYSFSNNTTSADKLGVSADANLSYVYLYNMCQVVVTSGAQNEQFCVLAKLNSGNATVVLSANSAADDSFLYSIDVDSTVVTVDGRYLLSLQKKTSLISTPNYLRVYSLSGNAATLIGGTSASEKVNLRYNPNTGVISCLHGSHYKCLKLTASSLTELGSFDTRDTDKIIDETLDNARALLYGSLTLYYGSISRDSNGLITAMDNGIEILDVNSAFAKRYGYNARFINP